MNARTKSAEKNYWEMNVSGRTLKILRAIGFAFLFIGVYIILSNLPVFSSSLAGSTDVGLALIFITGLLTSLHCVGMCSGFVIAYSMKTPEDLEKSKSEKVKQHLLYNSGRLLSYTAFGILAGLIGSVFLLTGQTRGYLSIFAGVFMVLYGLGSFIPWLRRFTAIRTPNLTNRAKGKGPFLFGLLNGLMPCGPLQAMLIYAAASGSALQGGLAMLTFGLGTMPLMFGLGNVLSYLSHASIGKVLKISAVIVMALGVITLNRGLLLSGYALPVPSMNLLGQTKLPSVSAASASSGDGKFQVINMTADNGWSPDTFTVSKGVPVRMNIFVKDITSCVGGIRIPKYGISRDFTQKGQMITLEFTPTEAGTVIFTCPMGMVSGRIIVENADGSASPVAASTPMPSGGSCGSSGGACGCRG
jgi:sulfite exporter TauE/SafE